MHAGKEMHKCTCMYIIITHGKNFKLPSKIMYSSAYYYFFVCCKYKQRKIFCTKCMIFSFIALIHYNEDDDDAALHIFVVVVFVQIGEK